jgi:hypothetical protein
MGSFTWLTHSFRGHERFLTMSKLNRHVDVSGKSLGKRFMFHKVLDQHINNMKRSHKLPNSTRLIQNQNQF